MKGKSITAVTWISALAGMMWLFGLGWAMLDHFSLEARNLAAAPANEKEEPVKKEGQMAVLAIGDSLTRGTGDPAGKGYVGYLADTLKERAQGDLSLQNLGIKGQRSEHLLQQIQQKEVMRQLQASDIILITIGGNDLFRGGEALLDLNEKDIRQWQEEYLDNLQKILSHIRTQNEQATIFLVGLYNPFSKLGNAQLTSKFVREWNYRSAEVCAEVPKAVFVPTFDLFELQVDDYLYSDKFHPNAEGYKLIADRVAALINW